MCVGIDIGASSTEAVIIDKHKKIVGFSVMPTEIFHENSAKKALKQACEQAKCNTSELLNIVGTGYGRKNIKGATHEITEISCHAKGVKYLFPGIRTILDVGGQDSKAIKISPNGTVIDFIMNEKCAAGTGRFLETMSRVLNIELEKMGDLSMKSYKEINLSSICAVFAESEVISKISEGEKIEDIINGIHSAVCNRLIAMLNKITIQSPLVMTGGVAKNIGIIKSLQNRLGFEVLVPEEPQIIGALGAALFAFDKKN